MHGSLLPQARQRLAAIRAATEESEAFNPNEQRTSRSRGDRGVQADPLWLGLLGASDPGHRSTVCRQVLDVALYRGVPRHLIDLMPPQGLGLTVIAAARGTLPIADLEAVARLSTRWIGSTDTSSDLVVAAELLGAERLGTLLTDQSMDSCPVLKSWCLATAAVATLAELGRGRTTGLDSLARGLNEGIDSLVAFFSNRSFRGMRRLAARRGAAVLLPPPGGDRIPVPTFLVDVAPAHRRCPGFRSFAAETLFAMGRAAVNRPSLDETDLQSLIDAASELASVDGGRSTCEIDWVVPNLRRLQEQSENGGVMPLEMEHA